MPGTLTRREPFSEFGELRRRFDRLFEDVLDGRERAWAPAIDVERDGKGNLLVRADVPGIKPEEVRIQVENDILTVSGEHEETKQEREKHYLRRERRYGGFSRSLALPAGVDPEKIRAVTHDGVVEVTVPLPKEPEKKAVTITPKAG